MNLLNAITVLIIAMYNALAQSYCKNHSSNHWNATQDGRKSFTDFRENVRTIFKRIILFQHTGDDSTPFFFTLHNLCFNPLIELLHRTHIANSIKVRLTFDLHTLPSPLCVSTYIQTYACIFDSLMLATSVRLNMYVCAVAPCWLTRVLNDTACSLYYRLPSRSWTRNCVFKGLRELSHHLVTNIPLNSLIQWARVPC